MIPSVLLPTHSTIMLGIACMLYATADAGAQFVNTYPIVDTRQSACYNNTAQIAAPVPGQAFFGQDAQHAGNQPQYRDNGDGTVTDLVTGLTWVKARGAKVSWEKALADATACRVGGHADWRMPTIKELYSLIDFRGKSATTAAASIPYLDTTYFDFAYGNTSIGERVIDCQDWSATTYVHLTMGGDSTAFGVNFADGRIKGYGKKWPPTGARMQLYVRYVRGNAAYGTNSFVDNNDSTVTDRATGLMWAKPDSRSAMNWSDALAWVQARNAAQWRGYTDWRLPNAKELQSIVDYTRSPATTSSPAIDPVFLSSAIGTTEYPFYWTSTTHLDNMGGVYVCFGRGLGWMQLPPTFSWQLYDVHGAGCQRSDPKTGSATNYPHGLGPQGDIVRIENHVRLVRGGTIVPVELSLFRAEVLDGAGSVRLVWRTQSETANIGFLVERRPAEASDWQTLPGSFTAGHGTTTAPHDYALVDAPGAGRWQYRLRQMDADGTHAYSQVVDVVIGGASASHALALAVHPNPVTRGADAIGVRYAVPSAGRVHLQFVDALGRIMLAHDEDIADVQPREIRMSTASLPAGSYLLVLISTHGVRTLPVVLLR